MSHALGLALGFAADRALGDPRRGHPVAAFGSVALRAEHAWYADARSRGVLHTAVLVGGVVALGGVAESRLPRTAATALATWVVLGGRSLEREALAVGSLLPDLPAARLRLTHLVGRDTSALDAGAIARAVIESVAENTSDAVVAPLLWGAVGGVPGLLGYRAINTLDAMIGHRSLRYRNFGWAAARLDDLVNLPASRTSAVLATVLGPDPVAARAAWRRDAGQHPSPNAGPVEAAFAGALGIRLGGANRYGDVVEYRGRLGDGSDPEPADIARAVALARRVDQGATVLAVLAAAGTTWLRDRVSRRRAARPRPPRRSVR